MAVPVFFPFSAFGGELFRVMSYIYIGVLLFLNSPVVMVRVLANLCKWDMVPVLSLVPESRLPPNGCWPTTEPVHLVFK